jgi:hypothetical protein
MSSKKSVERRDNAQSLPPFFVTKKIRKSIEQLLPAEHHKRLRLYFETYGCIRCSQSDVLYCANGLCVRCLRTVSKRLKRVDIKLRSAAPQTETLEKSFLSPYLSARRLLLDLVSKPSKELHKNQRVPKSPSKVYLKLLP